MRHKTFLSLVVYVRDEAEAVVEFLHGASDLLARHFELYEVVVVDDRSRDGTLERALTVAQEGSRHVVVVELAHRHGVEAGIQAGLERAVGDWVVELESCSVDHPLELLLEMYETAVTTGSEVVTAAGDRGPLSSRLFYRLVNRYADLDEPLRTERARLTSRRTLNAVLAMREKVRYRKALYAVSGARRSHLTYRSAPSAHSARTQRRLDRETWSLAFDVLLSCSGFGLRLAHRLSFLFGAVSLAVIAYAAGVYVVKDDVVEGWTTVTVLLSGGFAGLFLVLGVLGEYLARILVEVRSRPVYAVRAAHVFTPDRRRQHAPGPPRFLTEQAQLSTQLTDRHHLAAVPAPAEAREEQDERLLRSA